MLMKCPSKYNENPDFEPADHSATEVTEKSY
jgi:hypothetical protein